MKTIDFHPGIDLELLKEQRNHLCTMPQNEHLEGVLNLIDFIIDQLEA